MQKIKLAILELKYNGNVTGVNDLVVRLDKERFEPVFMYLSGYGTTENHLEKAGYKVFYLSQIKLINNMSLSLLWNLIKVLRANKIRLLHCHAHKAAFYGSLAGLFLPKLKIVVHIHGLKRYNKFNRKLSTFLFGWRINRFLCVAQAVKNDLIASNWRIDDKKAFVLENSVDYDKFADVECNRIDVRNSLGIGKDNFVFAAVGRLAPTKGLLYLIDAFGEVVKKFNNATLLLVGNGSDEQVLKDKVKLLGIEKTVIFAGFRSDVEKIFKSVDCFVISSVAEGMPRVLLEAMSVGLPCIGTAVGGIPKVIDESFGQVVPSKDSALLAEAMKSVIAKTPEQLDIIKEAAKQKAKQKYLHKVLAKELDKVYCDVLEIKH